MPQASPSAKSTRFFTINANSSDFKHISLKAFDLPGEFKALIYKKISEGPVGLWYVMDIALQRPIKMQTDLPTCAFFNA